MCIPAMPLTRCVALGLPPRGELMSILCVFAHLVLAITLGRTTLWLLLLLLFFFLTEGKAEAKEVKSLDKYQNQDLKSQTSPGS